MSVPTRAQLHALHRLRLLLRATERRRGATYRRVVVSRLDYIWLAPHPPLSLLEESCAWVPQAEDAGGLADRHAVLSREHAEAYLGRWEMIIDGRIMKLLPSLRQGTAERMTLTGERALADVLSALRIPVCRFAPTAYLACCAWSSSPVPRTATPGRDVSIATRRCSQPKCMVIKHNIRIDVAGASTSLADLLLHAHGRDASIARRRSPTGHAAAATLQKAMDDARGKYAAEVRASVGHALALALPGSRWARLPRGAPNTSLAAPRCDRISATTERGADAGRVERAFQIHDLAIVAPGAFEAGFRNAVQYRERRSSEAPLVRWTAGASAVPSTDCA